MAQAGVGGEEFVFVKHEGARAGVGRLAGREGDAVPLVEAVLTDAVGDVDGVGRLRRRARGSIHRNPPNLEFVVKIVGRNIVLRRSLRLAAHTQREMASGRGIAMQRYTPMVQRSVRKSKRAYGKRPRMKKRFVGMRHIRHPSHLQTAPVAFLFTPRGIWGGGIEISFQPPVHPDSGRCGDKLRGDEHGHAVMGRILDGNLGILRPRHAIDIYIVSETSPGRVGVD